MKEKLYKETFQGRWPFSVDKVILVKTGNSISVRFRIYEYALNGVATSNGFPNLPDKFWLDNPDIPGTKISLSDVISYALRNT